MPDKKEEESRQSGPDAKTVPEAAHLDVDIFETANEIAIYADVAGAHLHEMSITIEGENDVVVIQGTTVRPDEKTDGQHNEAKEPKRKMLYQECHWGPFFRQIILPEEIDVSRIDATIQHGVLMLKLPLLRSHAQSGMPKMITVKEG
ncbi:hypothetical protein A3C91_03475 [Candidatus Azambacteria bacterium RIFCSPHIGHO2_02_FULL_52_12]|uniref:SHSP domain-containing protein n=1 Tax=Candidatus Azambacteria bacterium RIFCSPLOWO2_01_FULL_46_25 TaxID=1797298 RepID=A0A1F5BV03_9BACT|nr:MAG: hypothetical protein A3C91_03475 [Candidatus Azambacteria bacterium RIFCSPHIGHO2_02_FULL_52_12]OGD34388.1 MAG: hypothetical protein A2988_02570 [Candidatus Azambacteria bacterium RIFCSPLOWO2_01_FULL_46_25]OGD37334.1 MAG: hypothetical protein A2850_01315 [Candidatus Azambacteria bacterium RIFCSPHIGHO2_01_FULL_51_74]